MKRIRSLIYIAITFTIIGFIIFIWFLYRGYFYEKFINISSEVNLEASSHFGDFIGGVVGTVFSFVGVILLFETLSLQRKDSVANREVFKHQQFDNTFFELLRFHKENIVSFSTYDHLGKEKRGRDFFIFQREQLQNSFYPKNTLSKNIKEAKSLFRRIYTRHEEEFSVYFKTLYQLYSLIDNSEISEEHKRKYSKLLRAQLSGCELFFIRYNAMTEHGKQSSTYINKYNILKHLSYFDLLEFKYWWSKLDDIEKNGLNIITKELITNIRKLPQQDEPEINDKKSYVKDKYKTYFIAQNNYEFSFKIQINSKIITVSPNYFNLINGIERFSNEEVENLFKCLFKYILFYSNFNQYNNSKHIRIERAIATNDLIEIKVSNINKEKLICDFNYYRKN